MGWKLRLYSWFAIRVHSEIPFKKEKRKNVLTNPYSTSHVVVWLIIASTIHNGYFGQDHVKDYHQTTFKLSSIKVD